MAKVLQLKCPECKEKFEIDEHEVDEGDYVECTECGVDLLLTVSGGNYKVKTDKEKFYEDTEEFDEYEEDHDNE